MLGVGGRGERVQAVCGDCTPQAEPRPKLRNAAHVARGPAGAAAADYAGVQSQCWAAGHTRLGGARRDLHAAGGAAAELQGPSDRPAGAAACNAAHVARGPAGAAAAGYAGVQSQCWAAGHARLGGARRDLHAAGGAAAELQGPSDRPAGAAACNAAHVARGPAGAAAAGYAGVQSQCWAAGHARLGVRSKVEEDVLRRTGVQQSCGRCMFVAWASSRTAKSSAPLACRRRVLPLASWWLREDKKMSRARLARQKISCSDGRTRTYAGKPNRSQERPVACAF